MGESTSVVRRIGRVSALAIFLIGILYVITGAIGLIASRDLAQHEPFTQIDPFLAILELLIILVAPPMVVMMASVHSYAPRSKKIYSLTALCFMTLFAGMTMSIHFVQLTIARRIESAGIAPLSVIFFSKWPSVLFALDLLAWDLFLGLSLLFAAPVFKGGRLHRWVRNFMTVSGGLCLAGIVGPATGDLRFQILGIIGYAFVFPVVCMLLAILFGRAESLSEGAKQEMGAEAA
ncbi:MAG TPA: hypothetical protein VKA60_12620 [Blastocatellia bacterium]|nr:hypothetical protein [Blastocatellia bacterium]